MDNPLRIEANRPIRASLSWKLDRRRHKGLPRRQRCDQRRRPIVVEFGEHVVEHEQWSDPGGGPDEFVAGKAKRKCQ